MARNQERFHEMRSTGAVAWFNASGLIENKEATTTLGMLDLS